MKKLWCEHGQDPTNLSTFLSYFISTKLFLCINFPTLLLFLSKGGASVLCSFANNSSRMYLQGCYTRTPAEKTQNFPFSRFRCAKTFQTTNHSPFCPPFCWPWYSAFSSHWKYAILSHKKKLSSFDHIKERKNNIHWSVRI